MAQYTLIKNSLATEDIPKEKNGKWYGDYFIYTHTHSSYIASINFDKLGLSKDTIKNLDFLNNHQPTKTINNIPVSWCNLFENCPKLAEINISNWMLPETIEGSFNLYSMCYNCKNLKALHLPYFPNVVKGNFNLFNMCNGCENLETLIIYNFPNIVKGYFGLDNMCKNCLSLTSLVLPDFPSGTAYYLDNIFDCRNSNGLYVSVREITTTKNNWEKLVSNYKNYLLAPFRCLDDCCENNYCKYIR